ncbi:apoptosis-inducing factor 3 isoform X2 [Fopius arisanus]|uniref:Apoptosis-inducing factor 3 isoform X2 n=1 Tax=Fopius arisanus TaxID=64838 RepID=A0A9R1TUW4_9HYME|nr:PREDICTED: apoptosis-inducing factor 3 isoform X2 [Fopius arisanus]
MGDKKNESEYVEGIVCKESEISENEMKVLPLGDEGGKILLIKQKGEIHAIGSKCTHYGALLSTGVLGDGRVRCPWHGACFNIKTGDIEDYPGMDCLPSYKVSVTNGDIKVQAKRTDLKDNRRVKEFTGQLDCEKTAVIVGGGPSAATCAGTLREEGFLGRIVMIAKEPLLPYDRVKASKDLEYDVEKSLLRSQSYYDERQIETKLSTEAVSLDTTAKTVQLSNGETLRYDYVFIATGSKPRRPDVPGSDLRNIFVLRDQADATAIVKQLSPEKNLVVLGLSFIALETAAYCSNKVASVTIVGRGRTPLKPVFGEAIGNRVREEFESKGIRFKVETNIQKFIGREDGTVHQVELATGEVLSADVVIVGIGSTLYTDWMKGSVDMRDDGSVVVNKHLETSAKGVYAGGDIAYAPVFIANDESSTISHYQLAQYHGRIAALNICGKNTALRTVPYFWTMLFGKGFRYSGFGSASSVSIYGSLEELKFFAYYYKNGKVIAMSSVRMDPIVSEFAEYLSEGKTLTQEEVEADPTGWMKNKPVDALKALPEKFSSSMWRCEHQQKRVYHTLTISHRKINSCQLSNYTMKMSRLLIKCSRRLLRP